MTTAKFVLKSKTIIGAVLVAVPLVFQLFGAAPPEQATLQQAGDSLVTLIEAGAQLAGIIMVVWGRLTAKQSLKVTP